MQPCGPGNFRFISGRIVAEIGLGQVQHVGAEAFFVHAIECAIDRAARVHRAGQHNRAKLACPCVPAREARVELATRDDIKAGGEPKPYIRIITQGATTYYVMQVPFDSRTIGNEASELYLADPNQQDNTARRYPSFPLKPANPPTYTLAPTVNNLPATVKSVDGINVTQTAYSTPGTQNPGFTFTERARTVRVDLSIAPIIDDFDVWAAGFFPGHPTPQSGQTVDADGDGQDNYSEYLAGTNPTQGNSVMRILTMTRAADGTNVTLNWASVSGKKYQIESSSTAGNAPDPWSPLGSEFTASGSASSLTVPASPTEPRRFFRVRIVP